VAILKKNRPFRRFFANQAAQYQQKLIAAQANNFLLTDDDSTD